VASQTSRIDRPSSPPPHQTAAGASQPAAGALQRIVQPAIAAALPHPLDRASFLNSSRIIVTVIDTDKMGENVSAFVKGLLLESGIERDFAAFAVDSLTQWGVTKKILSEVPAEQLKSRSTTSRTWCNLHPNLDEWPFMIVGPFSRIHGGNKILFFLGALPSDELIRQVRSSHIERKQLFHLLLPYKELDIFSKYHQNYQELLRSLSQPEERRFLQVLLRWVLTNRKILGKKVLADILNPEVYQPARLFEQLLASSEEDLKQTFCAWKRLDRVGMPLDVLAVTPPPLLKFAASAGLERMQIVRQLYDNGVPLSALKNFTSTKDCEVLFQYPNEVAYLFKTTGPLEGLEDLEGNRLALLLAHAPAVAWLSDEGVSPMEFYLSYPAEEIGAILVHPKDYYNWVEYHDVWVEMPLASRLLIWANFEAYEELHASFVECLEKVPTEHLAVLLRYAEKVGRWARRPNSIPKELLDRLCSVDPIELENWLAPQARRER